MSTNGVEIICNIKQRLFKQEKKLLEYRPDHFGKKSSSCGSETNNRLALKKNSQKQAFHFLNTF